MRFAGYAAIFDRPDSGGDIVRKGAFAGAPAKGVPLFWQHDPAHRIGTIESLREDGRGLRVIGIANVTSGGSPDAELRATVTAILQALRAHGLIEV
ncbi:HK97 family phage prohead protease [Aquisediminimonas profunda]|uniref:HK97 family phage prohead protease n=1 Tax=Aquisediminimonas profunda TaxID=1550733 RepID=UPI001C62B051|nr:HK97 family phage prohead protease [Aquisediminimonas profunda]